MVSPFFVLASYVEKEQRRRETNTTQLRQPNDAVIVQCMWSYLNGPRASFAVEDLRSQNWGKRMIREVAFDT